MSHWRIWDFSVIWNFSFLGHRFRSFEGPTGWNSISAITPFCLCQWPLRGPSDAARIQQGLCPPACGSEFIGHCGLWDSLPSLLGWLWQSNKENISEKLNPQAGPWATCGRPTGLGGAQGRRLCSLPTWGSMTSLLSSRGFWTSECQPSAASCYF